MNTFTEFQIYQILDKLLIRYDRQGFAKNKLSILCPFHSDKNLGSCFININSVIHCFSCGASGNLFSIVKTRNPGFTNKEVFNFLGLREYNKVKSILQSRKQVSSDDSNKSLYGIDFKSLKTKEVDLNLYYCKSRGFTKEWIDRHNIKIITEGYYNGYFSIPIFFNKEFISYEFRKAYEYERLKEVLKVRGSLEELRVKFKEVKNNLSCDKSLLEYLSKPKVLYPKEINVNNYIFNYDNLNIDEDLYICEGVAGIPEIKKENCTSLFGSNVSEKQIELLRKFKKRKILVVDNDKAGNKLLEELVQRVENLWIFPGNISGAEYLLEKSGLFSGIKIA